MRSGHRPKVSSNTVFNLLGHGRFAVSASDSQTRELPVKVTERDLRGFEAAFSHCGIAHRPDALRRSILSATTFCVQMRT
ncbi:hypothetical protein GCM10011345_34620 [Gemmobacter megaterium]|uniref:hypothetical protein n=1 Tax=Gemmobacter megaterium TaxID=1086013 RepID=UPI000970D3D7|nr:hypothetical protein [Gemmobacter megaterium]GGE25756.1 hypothetical protein GCM10011345_34620 [Gemmobacter megaterium]